MNNMIKVQGLEDKVRQLYVVEGKSTVEIGKMFKIAPINVSKLLREQGIEVKGNLNSGRKCQFSFNEDFFRLIDCEEKAYWLGFIYADGYVTAEKLTGISLSTNDESHLLKFKNIVEFDGNITRSMASFGDGYPMTSKSRIILRSNVLFEDLGKLGVMFKKTSILTFPSNIQVPEEFVHHFIRGYFDGDGSVYSSLTCKLAFNILGTQEFLTTLRSNLPIESKAKLYKEKRSATNVWYITIGGIKNSRLFYNYIYSNATVFLDRKKEKFESLLN